MNGRFLKKIVSCLVLVVFILTSVPSSFAQTAALLPQPGSMVGLSAVLEPPSLKGIKVYANDPFKFDFILDTGKTSIIPGMMEVSSRLVRYFLASLTIPEKDMWVNLSPYEKDRIVPEAFGQTEMGRDLLAQDYMLKQITASVIYPEGETGKKFWEDVYAKAYAKYGTIDIPVDTFNKVWIVPQKAVVYENKDAAYITESRLKVMLETDYFAISNNNLTPVQGSSESQAIAKDVFREIIIPLLEREVNEGENFVQLRQVYRSLILAAWYKKKIKESLLDKVYVDRNKVAGVGIDDPKEAEKIWAQYVEAFKKGAFNYIKEEAVLNSNEMIPRKYFSGGVGLTDLSELTLETTSDVAGLPDDASNLFVIPTKIAPSKKDISTKDDAEAANSPKATAEAVRKIKAAIVKDPEITAGGVSYLMEWEGVDPKGDYYGYDVYRLRVMPGENWHLKFAVPHLVTDRNGAYVKGVELFPDKNKLRVDILSVNMPPGLFPQVMDRILAVLPPDVVVGHIEIQSWPTLVQLAKAAADQLNGLSSDEALEIRIGELSSMNIEKMERYFDAFDQQRQKNRELGTKDYLPDGDFQEVTRFLEAYMAAQREIPEKLKFLGDFYGETVLGKPFKERGFNDYSVVFAGRNFLGLAAFSRRLNSAETDHAAITIAEIKGMEMLGEGGRGSVYQDPQDPKIYYKIVYNAKDGQKEAQAISNMNLKHPELRGNVPQLLAEGKEEGSYWMKLEGIENGVDLGKDPSFWDNEIDLLKKIDMLRQITRVIEALHRSEVAFNDIKPTNIIIDRKGQIMLIDFGEVRSFGTPRSGFTRNYSFNLKKEPNSSSATDVYSLGKLMQAALSRHEGGISRSVSEEIDYLTNNMTATASEQRPSVADVETRLASIGEMVSKENKTGGIDFTAEKMNVETRGNAQAMRFNVDPSMFQQLQDADGFSPVIINIASLKF